MPTFQKTFSFQTGAEGLVYNGGSAASGGWVSGDSASGSGGCYRMLLTSKNLSVNWSATQSTSSGGTPQTWEQWGAPIGTYIQAVQLISWSRKTAANTLMTTPLNLNVFLGSVLMGGTGNLATTTTGWVSAPAGTLQTPAPDIPSQNSVVLNFNGTISTTSGGGQANADFRFDEITFEVTYTTSPQGGIFDSTDPLGMSGFFGT